MNAAAKPDNFALGAPLRFGPGKRAQPLRHAYDRELTAEDFLAAANSELVQSYSPIQKIKQRHHMLARVLAKGMTDVEAALVVGMDPQYVNNLKNQDPSFGNLLDFYKRMEAEAYSLATADMHKRLAALGFDSLSELHERLENDPEKFTNKELLAVIEATADRTGFGKTSTVNHQHEHSISAETIARIKSESVDSGAAVAAHDREALLRLSLGRTAQELPEAQEGDWIEGEGHCVREEGNPEAE